jgi:type IX secretion system PorP/SprF family membrane protein
MRPKVHLFILSFLLIFSLNAYSQISLLDAQFFQNRYLANPAMAGLDGGLRMNLGYRNQWSNIPGSPIDQNFTMDYRKDKAGTGFSLINAKSGDISHTKMYGTYSYALQLNDGSGKLHFGMNLGVQTVSFNTQNIIGDPNDRNIARFSDRKALVDGDFGFGFTSDRFSIDGAVYNLKSQFSNDNGDLNLGADFNLFYVGTSYSIPMPEWRINTKLAYRNIKNYTDIVDIAAEVRTSNNKLGFTGIYHTNKSSTFGVSYLHTNEWQFLGMYNNAQSPISSYALGTFEIALQVNVQNLIKKKKK